MVRKSFVVAARSPFPAHPAHAPSAHVSARSYASSPCGPKYKSTNNDNIAGVTGTVYKPATVACCSVNPAAGSMHPVTRSATDASVCNIVHPAASSSEYPTTSSVHPVAYSHNSGYAAKPIESPYSVSASCSDAVTHGKLDYRKIADLLRGEMVHQPAMPIMDQHDADARMLLWIKIAIGGLVGCAFVLTVAPAALAATGAAKVTTGSSAAFFVKGSAVASSSGPLLALGQSIQNLIPASCALGVGILSTQAQLPTTEDTANHASLIHDHDEHNAWKNGPRHLSLMHDREDTTCQGGKDVSASHGIPCEADKSSHTEPATGGTLGSLRRRVVDCVSRRDAMVFAAERDKTTPLSGDCMVWARTPTPRASSPVSSATLALFRRK
eukprot:GEMP01035611.1.p1 GENE.GEMP01035611.1~~GEMP01035611.1.p1  ORF type:complete len:383 (+),score=90.78 GEMP01035611.1:136-1284(+)